MNDANYNIISSTTGLRNIVDVLGNLYSLGVDVEALKAIKELALKTYSSIVLKFSRLQKTYTPIPISALIYSKQWNITSKILNQLNDCAINQNIIDTNNIFKNREIIFAQRNSTNGYQTKTGSF